ncbi:MAG: hypothetical protein HYZ48_05930, partial [Chlamydiales bacterium]|nr:hypothetical protein [Chlamydiales bacterium]
GGHGIPQQVGNIAKTQECSKRSISGSATLTHLRQFESQGLKEPLRNLVVDQAHTHEMPNIYLDAMRLEAGMHNQGMHTSVTGVPAPLLLPYQLCTEMYRQKSLYALSTEHEKSRSHFAMRAPHVVNGSSKEEVEGDIDARIKEAEEKGERPRPDKVAQVAAKVLSVNYGVLSSVDPIESTPCFFNRQAEGWSIGLSKRIFREALINDLKLSEDVADEVINSHEMEKILEELAAQPCGDLIVLGMDPEHAQKVSYDSHAFAVPTGAPLLTQEEVAKKGYDVKSRKGATTVGAPQARIVMTQEFYEKPVQAVSVFKHKHLDRLAEGVEYKAEDAEAVAPYLGDDMNFGPERRYTAKEQDVIDRRHASFKRVAAFVNNVVEYADFCKFDPKGHRPQVSFDSYGSITR